MINMLTCWCVSVIFLVGLSGTCAENYTIHGDEIDLEGRDEFRERIFFDADDDYHLNEELRFFDEQLLNETLENTDATSDPKTDTTTESPDVVFDNALLLAFHKQLKALSERRRLAALKKERQCGRRLARNARIVGGQDTYEGEFPWAVSVRLLTTHNCGGTIITKDWVLTAAHCVKRYAPRYFRVRPGDDNVGIRGIRYDLDIHVAEIIIHANFGKPRRYSNDLALLRLKRPIKFNNYAQPICLPDPDIDYSGRNATAVGWGATKEGQLQEGEIVYERPNVLQKVSVPILTNKTCAEWYADVYQGYVQIYDYQICAGFQEGGRDACQGDSGGPLVTKEDDHFTLVGIVSAGVGCARKQLPGLYSRISIFVPWIRNVTGV